MDERPTAWCDANLAIAVLVAAGRELGGIHVRARVGPVLDLWLDRLCAATGSTWPMTRISAATPESRLVGGLNVAASLKRGGPVADPGLLAKVDGGVLVLSMAERATPTFAGIVADALDQRFVRSEGHGVSRRDAASFALVALDEGVEEERLPYALADRLGLRVDLSTVAWSQARAAEDEIAPRQCDFRRVDISDTLLEAISVAALQAGRASMRAALGLSRTARVLAAMDHARSVEARHVATAIRLVLGAAIMHPGDEEVEATGEAESSAPRGDDKAPTDTGDGKEKTFDPEKLRDMLVASATIHGADRAGLPPGKTGRSRGAMAAGKSGAVQDRSRRGRPAGITARPPYPDARPNVIATLRAAAPWQKLRRRDLSKTPARQMGGKVVVHKSDFRFIRYRHETRSAAIFIVDASGSTAMERLGEAKGAVELLLGDCYVRRDNVAVISFRGVDAEVVVEPTRSLVRAKRLLTGLPGGGATPLAAGLARGIEVAAQVRRGGLSPLLVLLTDGNGNVALDGRVERQAARQDAEAMARHCASLAIPGLVIDIARRRREAAGQLAASMLADYRLLPRADAVAVSDLVGNYMRAQ